MYDVHFYLGSDYQKENNKQKPSKRRLNMTEDFL